MRLGATPPGFKSRSLRHTTEHAPVAQRIEHLTTDQKVGGSNPSGRAVWLRQQYQVRALFRLSETRPFLPFGPHRLTFPHERLYCLIELVNLAQRIGPGLEIVVARVHIGRVGHPRRQPLPGHHGVDHPGAVRRSHNVRSRQPVVITLPVLRTRPRPLQRKPLRSDNEDEWEDPRPILKKRRR